MNEDCAEILEAEEELSRTRLTNDIDHHEDMSSSNTNQELGMLYSVEDTPPIATSVILGFQHCMMAFGGIAGYPLLIANALCMFETPEGLIGRGMLINTMLFTSGVCTILQSTLGIRLPIMQGAPFAIIPIIFAITNTPDNKCPTYPAVHASNNSMITLYNDTDGQIVTGEELWQRRIREIQGSLAIASLFQIIVGATGLLGVIMRYVTPITLTTCVTLVATSLIYVAHEYSSIDWKAAFITAFVLVLTLQYLDEIKVPIPAFTFKKHFHAVYVKIFKMFPVIIALMVGWLSSFIFTSAGMYTEDQTDKQYMARSDSRSSVWDNSVWFRIPYPFQWGMVRANAATVAGLLAAVIAGMIESLSDYHATSRISGAPKPPIHALNRATFCEGFGCLLNAIIGSGGSTTSYSANSGAIDITRVGSRRMMQVAGVLLIILGLFGKIGAIFVMIPNSVIGGCFMPLLGMLTGVGLYNLNGVNLNYHRNVFMLGVSLFLGLMIPDYIQKNPEAINTGIKDLDQILLVLLGIPLLVGGVISVFFDVTLPGERSKFLDLNEGGGSKETRMKKMRACYNLPFNTKYKYSKYFPILPEHDGY